MTGGKKIDMWCMVIYSPIYTSNNSIKTHRLKHRHDRKREKKYEIAICSLSHQTIQ